MRHYLLFLLLALAVPALCSDACARLDANCEGQSCTVILGQGAPQYLPTPWSASCLDTGAQRLRLEPKHPGYEALDLQWSAQEGEAYGITHRPYPRQASLPTPPESWNLLASWQYGNADELSFSQALLPQLGLLASLRREGHAPLPDGLEASLLASSPSHLWNASLGWREQFSKGYSLHAAVEMLPMAGPLPLRATLKTHWPSRTLDPALGIAFATRPLLMEIGAEGHLPLYLAGWKRRSYGLAPALRLKGAAWHGFTPTLALTFPYFMQGPGWQAGLVIQYSPPPPPPRRFPPPKEAPPAHAAWLAAPHPVYNIASQQLRREGTRLPTRAAWKKHMEALAKSEGKTSPLCRPDESLYVGLCLPSSCGEWLLSDPDEPLHLWLSGLPGLPGSCLPPQLQLRYIPPDKQETGFHRPWLPLLP